MIIPPGSKFPTIPDSSIPTSSRAWEKIARLCRRLCVLEERGDEAAADALRGGELAQALAAIRAESVESPEAVQLRFDYILVEERERVANAAVLAELLAPMLGGSAPAGIAANDAHSPAPLAIEAPLTAPAPERPRPVNIADFIDEMLAQERSPPHGQRRAS